VGKVNNWFAERLGPAQSQGLGVQNVSTPTADTLPIIIETEPDAGTVPVASALSAFLSSTPRQDTAFNMMRVVVPTDAIAGIADLSGVKMVSYDAPVWLRALPGLPGLSNVPKLPGLPNMMGGFSGKINDPILGPLELSPIAAPQGMNKTLLEWGPKALALTPLAWGANILSSMTGMDAGGVKANIHIIPTDETRKWMGLPADHTFDMKVAVLDTGNAYPHPLFKYGDGAPRIESTTGESGYDGLGHGTWCCTAAFGGTTQTRFGRCTGVAYTNGANLMSVKCLTNAGFGTSWFIIKAMEMAYKWGAKVVSMSLGGPLQGSVTEDPQCQVIERLKDEVIFLVAAGNDGPGSWTVGSPGASPHALTIGSWSTYYDGLSIFSSRGPNGEFYKENEQAWLNDLATFGDDLIKPDAVAPGGGPVEEGQTPDMIYSGVVGWMDGMNDLTPGDGFDAMRGTSMATPHAAGLVAWLRARGLVKTTAEIKELLAVGTDKDDQQGYGAITYERLAVEQAEPIENEEDEVDPPVVSMSWQASTTDFEVGSTEVALMRIRNTNPFPIEVQTDIVLGQSADSPFRGSAPNTTINALGESQEFAVPVAMPDSPAGNPYPAKALLTIGEIVLTYDLQQSVDMFVPVEAVEVFTEDRVIGFQTGPGGLAPVIVIDGDIKIARYNDGTVDVVWDGRISNRSDATAIFDVEALLLVNGTFVDRQRFGQFGQSSVEGFSMAAPTSAYLPVSVGIRVISSASSAAPIWSSEQNVSLGTPNFPLPPVTAPVMIGRFPDSGSGYVPIPTLPIENLIGGDSPTSTVPPEPPKERNVTTYTDNDAYALWEDNLGSAMKTYKDASDDWHAANEEGDTAGAGEININRVLPAFNAVQEARKGEPPKQIATVTTEDNPDWDAWYAAHGAV
jgi:subtilisin family serine protease